MTVNDGLTSNEHELCRPGGLRPPKIPSGRGFAAGLYEDLQTTDPENRLVLVDHVDGTARARCQSEGRAP